MNLFRRKKVNHTYQEEELSDLVQNEESSWFDQRLDKRNSTPDDNKEKSSYQLDPILFRRLIEGTSFDHREIIEHKPTDQRERSIQEKGGGSPKKKKVPIIPEKPVMSRRSKVSKFVNYTGKRKKFINKEQEKRLGNIVHEVLRYSKRGNTEP